ncbi:MAG: FtsQ-type POTRA domain-containing protein [Peptococcaceae bacterium]|nr:FtsQ-type POTRA domain-containing protein [Peptococcaceae bacterium]
MEKKSSGLNKIKRILVLIFFLSGIYVLAQSSFFKVKEIRVIGNKTLSIEKIVTKSEIYTGDNIFKIDLKTSEEMIITIPEIKRVDMSRIFPATVEIKIVEREPLVLLPIQGGFVQVDEDGVCLRSSDLVSDKFPVITGVEFKNPIPGKKIVSKSLDKGIMTVKAFPKVLLSLISEINIEGDKIIAYTTDGIQCRLGMAEDMKKKGEVFLKVLEELKVKDNKIEYLDLSLAESPVVKYAK